MLLAGPSVTRGRADPLTGGLMHRKAHRSHPISKMLAVLLGMALVALFGFAAPGASAAPKDPKPSSKLACFGTGTCTVNPDGSYTLANRVIPGSSTSTEYGDLELSCLHAVTTLTTCTETATNDFAFTHSIVFHSDNGVTIQSTAAGHTLNSVSDLGFSYSQDKIGVVRELQIFLDSNDDGFWDLYLSIPPGYCGGGAYAGTIDVLTPSFCIISVSNGSTYGNWAELLEDYGDAVIAPDAGRVYLYNESAGFFASGATARVYDVAFTSTEVTGTTPDTTDQYSGVYLTNGSLAGKAFEDITRLGFSYVGDVSGGSPRFSIPITGGGYVFIDAASCGDGTKVAPLTDTTCAVSGYTSVRSFYYSSWAAFLAAENLVVGAEASFIIADQPGTVSVADIELGNAAKGRR